MSTRNLPRHRVYRINLDVQTENIKPKERRMPIKEPIKLQERGNKGKILNIAACDPQL